MTTGEPLQIQVDRLRGHVDSSLGLTLEFRDVFKMMQVALVGLEDEEPAWEIMFVVYGIKCTASHGARGKEDEAE